MQYSATLIGVMIYVFVIILIQFLNIKTDVYSKVIGINLWLEPHNSAHNPYDNVGVNGVTIVEITRPGVASNLIPIEGTDHLWITSNEEMEIRTIALIGKITRLSQSDKRNSEDSHSFIYESKVKLKSG